jgi:PadR family transcriptional regulator, regulatory protein AphA
VDVMSLRHAVLGLLADQPASGYDLMKRFDRSLGHVWSATRSQVYGELAKLTANGWIIASAEGPRGRTEYSVTDAGRAELRHWLAEVEPSRTVRDDALLRVFFLGQLPPDQARRYLMDYAASGEARGRALAAVRDEAPPQDRSPFVHYALLALERGLRLEKMTTEWATWAAAQVDTAGTDDPPATHE